MKWELDNSTVLSDSEGSYEVWVCKTECHQLTLGALNGVARLVYIIPIGKHDELSLRTIRALEGYQAWSDRLTEQIKDLPVADARAYLETVFVLEEQRDFI